MAGDVRAADAPGLTSVTRVVVVTATVVFLLLAAARARADRPWVDEGWFASPAVNLVLAGHMGTTILDPGHFQLTGLNQYTYWIMPLYPLSLAGWFAAAGVGVVTMRAFSVVWGLIGFLALVRLGGVAARSPRATAAAALLLGVDFVLVRAGAIGRMDMMAAALGFVGLAFYLACRETSLVRAVTGGATAAALAWMTHPAAGVHLMGLCVLLVWLDARRLSAGVLVALVLPNVVAAAAWAGYIAIEPAMFTEQFSKNVGRRFSLLSQPLAAIAGEWQRYFGGTPGSIAGLLRTALIVPYGAGLVWFAVSREFRRSPGAAVFALLAVTAALGMVVLDSRKIYLYALHVTPYAVSLTALLVAYLHERPALMPRWLLAAAVLGMVALQGAGTAYTILRNGYERDFSGVARAVASAVATGDFVVGSAELAFPGGFGGQVLDDVTLGFHNGRTPDVVVLDERYQEYVNSAVRRADAEGAHIRGVLAELSARQVLGPYELRRRPSPHP